MISCIMPTRDRAAWIGLAVESFKAQAVAEETELIVVDDEGAPDVSWVVNLAERVRYFRVRAGLSIGEKRNFACSHAQGEYIATFDDDDWSSSDRLANQLRALVSTKTQITALCAGVHYYPGRQQAWLWDARRLIATNPRAALGNTLMFRRAFWLRVGGFRPISNGEDQSFLGRARDGELNRTAGLWDVVTMIHGNNTAKKRPPSAAWSEVDRAELVARMPAQALAEYDRIEQ